VHYVRAHHNGEYRYLFKNCFTEVLTQAWDVVSTFLCEKGGAKSTLSPKALCLRTGAHTTVL